MKDPTTSSALPDDSARVSSENERSSQAELQLINNSVLYLAERGSFYGDSFERQRIYDIGLGRDTYEEF